jgi:hypothetical protein
MEIAVSNRSVGYDEFLRRSIQKYGKKFTYVEESWKGLDHDIQFVCPRHGLTFMKAKTHIRKVTNTGCRMCGHELRGRKRRMQPEEFFFRCNRVHEENYDYTNSKLVSTAKEITIFCKSEGHGYFTQIAGDHLRGSGCPKCSVFRLKTNLDFIKSCKKVHGDLYDYSSTEYMGSVNKVVITCRIHGRFPQNASSHLNGSGCPECSKTLKIGWDSVEELLEERERHKQECDFYIYNLIGYPDLIKIGIASNHSKRAESYGKERNLPYGDLVCAWRCSTRIEARLIELSVLQGTLHMKNIPSRLADRVGFTEVRKCNEEEIIDLCQRTFDSLSDWIDSGGTIWEWAINNLQMPPDIRIKYQEKVCMTKTQ